MIVYVGGKSSKGVGILLQKHVKEQGINTQITYKDMVSGMLDIKKVEGVSHIIVTDYGRSTIVNMDEVNELAEKYPETTIMLYTASNVDKEKLASNIIDIVEMEDNYVYVSVIKEYLSYLNGDI